MKLVNKTYNKTRKGIKSLKNSKTGLEAEFHLIDEKGLISDRASEIISASNKKNEEVVLTKEIGNNIIEFGCYPDVETYNPTLHLIESIEKVADLCQSKDLSIYPFATYPGKFKSVLSNDKKYNIQKKIFGDRIGITSRVTGFHHHYSLPKGVFDAQSKSFRVLRKSKIARSLTSSYNFEIASDPVLTLFTQSSPFYEGVNLAKDSRVVVYRGGKKLKYMEGLYAKHQQIGGLPPYKHTATDLLISLNKRWDRWRREVKKASPNTNFDKMYPNKLEIGWHPVKINKHGTLEQRGMDINFPSILMAVTVLLKFCLKNIQRDFIEVMPVDFGMDEAFKLENGILYIPPHTSIRDNLQKWSAYDGYSKKQMHKYAKRFFSFARSITPKRYSRIIKPVYEMIDDKSSVSDKILKYAKYKGYLQDGKISNEDAAKLALYYSSQFSKDLKHTQKALQRVSIV